MVKKDKFLTTEDNSISLKPTFLKIFKNKKI